MNYEKYYEARDIVKEIIEKDLLGSLDDEEIINDYPISYYILGKLYPQQCITETEISNAEDAGELDDEPAVAADTGRFPSSIGISFSLSKKAEVFKFVIKAAKYHLLEETDSDTKKPLWKREIIFFNSDNIFVSDLVAKRRLKVTISEGLVADIFLHKTYKDGSRTVSVTLINTNVQSKTFSRMDINLNTFFQPYIKVVGKEDAFTDVRKM
ncbi:hypothetical protein CIY_14020 [Butyrivibrio fibrisolvens 16/4]|nr:hypothetical protein CIY_14020 [Butyrivibrio fibrisolvens 16/4]